MLIHDMENLNNLKNKSYNLFEEDIKRNLHRFVDDEDGIDFLINSIEINPNIIYNKINLYFRIYKIAFNIINKESNNLSIKTKFRIMLLKEILAEYKNKYTLIIIKNKNDKYQVKVEIERYDKYLNNHIGFMKHGKEFFNYDDALKYCMSYMNTNKRLNEKYDFLIKSNM